MNEEEREAIEFIKDLIAWDVKQDLCPNKEECKNLEIILNLIEKLQKENEELKESNRKLYEIGQEMCKQDKYTSENYIPIQKVKDKIEEIKNIANELSQEIEKELKSEDICREYIRDKRRELGLANRDIKLLQELLEGRK